ncbi:unnamed protein product, partial [Coregonus sp. 'balchen']
SQAEAHYKGTKHAKKLKAQENTKNKPPKSSLPPPPLPPSLDKQIAVPPSTADKTLASPNAFVPIISNSSSLAALTAMAVLSPCNPVLCDPTPASPPSATQVQLQGPVMKSSGSSSTKPGLTGLNHCYSNSAHARVGGRKSQKAPVLFALQSGRQLSVAAGGPQHRCSKHKTMLEARNGAGPIKAYPRPGSKLKVQATTVLKGSGLQNKTFHCEICDVHVNSEIQLKQAKLALQKDLVKPISPAAFLSNPFCPTTVPSIALHPRPNTSIFQTAGLPGSMSSMGSFLRAAPGPIRPTTGSILFAPY